MRGRLVRLDATWHALRERRSYGPAEQMLLAELAAAAALMAQDLEFEGSLIVQLRRGKNDLLPFLRAAMAECRGSNTIRAIVRRELEATPVNTSELADLFGGGDLAITLRSERGETYQGIVALGPGGLATHLERYFDASEQLPTRLWLACDEAVVAGLMLQRLPGAVMDADAEDHWRRVTLLADTVRPAELLRLSPDILLRRLFDRDRVRLHAAQPVCFGCSCTRERSSNALKLMEPSEVTDILREDGVVKVTCEFCGASYDYDAVDTGLLLHDTAAPANPAIH